MQQKKKKKKKKNCTTSHILEEKQCDKRIRFWIERLQLRALLDNSWRVRLS